MAAAGAAAALSARVQFAAAFAPAPRRGYTARMNPRPHRFPAIALLLAAALALPACGNKGPLVLPDEPEEAAAPADDTDTDAPADETPADETSSDETPAGTTDDADAPAAPPPEDG